MLQIKKKGMENIKMKIILSFFCCWIFGVGLIPAAYPAQKLKIVEQRGKGRVRLVKYDNGGWQILVDNNPYFIKGLCTDPIKVGERLTASNMWMNYDYNHNGINDVAYESWVDKNGNNIQDKDEPAVGDFQLMKEMGANTLRIYHPDNINKELLRDLYKKYGIMVMMGNFLGAYTRGSGASWEEGTDYTNSKHLESMLEDVRKMVVEFKDEPYILMWLLGNENDAVGSKENSTFNNTNARQRPGEFARFVNKVAEMIHQLDKNHPVGVSNALEAMLPYYKKYTPAIDFLGFNSYTGPYGFGALFRKPKFFGFDRAVVITEYGGDSWDSRKQKEDEDFQAFYHKGAWRDMAKNSAASGGCSVGGFVYNWLDGWWFCGKLDEHDTVIGAWQGPMNDAWVNDEWLGVCSQGDGKNSPFLRRLKKAYYFYKEEWNKN